MIKSIRFENVCTRYSVYGTLLYSYTAVHVYCSHTGLSTRVDSTIHVNMCTHMYSCTPTVTVHLHASVGPCVHTHVLDLVPRETNGAFEFDWENEDWGRGES